MNNESKSIWKKNLRTPGLLLAWAILAVVIMIIITIYLAMTGQSMGKDDNFIAMIIFACVIPTLVVGLWMFIRWIRNWRNFKRFVFGVACLATFIALFYAEEDWRSLHALNEFKQQLAAKNEKFDFKDLIPAPVPDDQNFALAPIVYSSYGQILTRDGQEIPSEKRDTNFVNRLQMPTTLDNDSPTNDGGRWDVARLTNLKPWQSYYRDLTAKTNLFPVSPQPQSPAADVLLALSKYDSQIEELRAASRLPYSRFPVDYSKDEPAAILLPHLAMMKSCLQVLRLRATAELQNGEADKAAEDIKLMLYLTQSLRTEPILISHLVRIAMAAITLQPVYDGLAEHRWNDAELASLDTELSKFDFLADYEFAMHGEMSFGLAETEYLRRSRNFQALDYDESGGHNSEASHWGLRLAPASLFYWNELTIAQMHEQWTLPLVDAQKQIVHANAVRDNDAAVLKQLQRGWPYNFLARMIFPAVRKSVVKFARAQSSLDLARTAIALERYRLAHGEYPEALDALAPQFMDKVPHDIIGGQPLHYQRTSDGQFVLYSVGWNGIDDGGVVAFKNTGRDPRDESSSTVDIEKGDWVWRYPPK